MYKKPKRKRKKLIEIYPYMTNGLLSIQQLLDRAMIFDLQRQIDINNMDIILLKNKIIELNQSNQNSQLFIQKLLSRYFSDYIIKILYV